MTDRTTEEALTPEVLSDLLELHARTSHGVWGQGATSHNTVAKREGQPDYRIADFHHADDASFVDAAHKYMPLLIAALQWQAEQQKGEARKPDDEVVRYCPECGLIGPVKDGHHTCCPDSFGMSMRRWQAEKMERMLDRLRTQIAASPHGVPPGYVLAPVEPTPEMLRAANKLPDTFSLGDEYRAMLSSLPQEPQGEQWTCQKCGDERWGPLIACKQDGCPSAPPPLAQGDSQ